MGPVEVPRVCEKCGAKHAFFVSVYDGDRAHSAVTETVMLTCRKCKEPFFEWDDKDGDSFTLLLEDDPMCAELRARARERERRAAAPVYRDGAPSDDRAPHLKALVLAAVLAALLIWAWLRC
jgi:hypothetical protein